MANRLTDAILKFLKRKRENLSSSSSESENNLSSSDSSESENNLSLSDSSSSENTSTESKTLRTKKLHKNFNKDARHQNLSEESQSDSEISDSEIRIGESEPGPSNYKVISETKKVKKKKNNDNESKTLKKPSILFEELTPLYDNENVQIFVVRDYLKRQKIFKFDDHLYSIKVKLLSGRPPLLSSILDALESAMEFCLKKLKTYYSEGKYGFHVFY